jgi:hypothetical protein
MVVVMVMVMPSVEMVFAWMVSALVQVLDFICCAYYSSCH